LDAPPPSRWQTATVTKVTTETTRAKTFRLALSQFSRHLAGQHYIVRLTAPDGYTAARSYSVASAPDDSGEIEITVERLEDGEVSSYLHEAVVPGDDLEVRGPIGGWFVWRGDTPALLVGGGSGVVPLMAMLRLARREGSSGLVCLVVSVSSSEELFYAKELPGPETTIVFTRQTPPGCNRPPRQLGEGDLKGVVLSGATAYVCGTSGFADHVTGLLARLEVPDERIRVERFGPSS
jgi:ferredoxin-NADP reductase